MAKKRIQSDTDPAVGEDDLQPDSPEASGSPLGLVRPGMDLGTSTTSTAILSCKEEVSDGALGSLPEANGGKCNETRRAGKKENKFVLWTCQLV